MNTDWKWAAIPAAFAVIISLLTGLVAGVAFLPALLRAILGAALFAVIGSGIGLLVSSQLPELLEKPSQAPRRSGGRVDITVGDEDEESQETSGEEAGQEASEEGGSPLSSRDEDDSGDITSLEGDEIEAVELRRESRPPAPRQETVADITESLVEEVEESSLPDEELSKASLFEQESYEGGEFESLEELPDIGGFEGAFNGGSSEDEGQAGEQEGAGGSFDSGFESDSASWSRSSRSAPEGLDAGNDPAQIAKALQTMLKRDS
ncbi:MAG: hypothetical protein ACLFP6_03630 [Spirochaetaceae bacterium]